MNPGADALSRNTLAAVQLGLDYNALVEALRQYLEYQASLMFCCKDSNWFTQHPWVLLGLRTFFKDVLNVSAAEMVYGYSLVVPAECFPSTTSSNDLQHILHFVGKFTPCRQTYKPPAKHHIPTHLHSVIHVFLCNDTSKPPPTPPYTGPFLVMPRSPRAFLLNIRGKED
ncbi:uncharacterized protein [Palaemon carinicauda]|uniref:uncharacterized protein n=1 Tax=Palaemon carinicauda TaxID=392227 RepID=UPI0035B57C2B